MAQSERPATVLVGMIIATIYVIMLISLTRSSYFIGGGALERAGRPVIAVNQVMAAPETERPLCSAPQAKLEEPQDCSRAPRTLRRVLALPRD